ncbi:hypothetical protein A1OO_06905 [Enterovibrio norvegicus FF-33]|uniref:glycosyltransferase family 9 protein n=1 Tax=Enterovibrio norvegicus TaxID=188144 RepID=UPI0002F7B218|nr:glycosyltransferase family 9 protein [Enterovibrio norvegicus]OEE68765.1 hypothetical protein A1OO_06905 [Enterovibrio norvegicus FF-33]
MFKRLISYLQLSRDRFRRWLGLKLFDAGYSKQVKVGAPHKIVLLRWDAKWGDAIVSSFVFDAIRQTYPDAEIELVTTPQMANLFRDYYEVDKVHEIKKRPTYSALKALAAELSDVDVLVHLSPILKMKDLYFLRKVGAKAVAGLDDEVNLINLKLGEKTKGLHFSEKFIQLLSAIGVESNAAKYSVPLNSDAQSTVEKLLANKEKLQLVVFNPYGSGNSRKLNKTKIIQIIDDVLAFDSSTNIALLHTPDTEQEIQEICLSRDDERVFFNPSSKTIYDAIALVSMADKVISVDTAIIHIASGLDKPLLGIYNPDEDNFAAWHPNSSNAIVLFAKKRNPPDISALDLPKLNAAIQQLLEM